MKLHPLRLATVVAATAMFSAAALVALPANSTASCAQVEVHHVRPAEGALMIAVYADAASFDKKPHVALQLRATAATMNVPICDLAGMSSAALMLYQDLNGNGKLDRNVLGIPSEPWGASGKPVPMAAPTWDATAVPLDGTPVVVKLSK